MESISGTTFSDTDLASFAKGPNEEDLVNSGLEETMIQAFHQLRERRKIWSEGPAAAALGTPVDLRTTAFALAIDRIAVSYQDLGIFP
jgi:glutamate dehydrogenase (NAD(P)+)